MSIIIVGTDGLCFCGAHNKCVKGKLGSMYRCTKEELQKEGYQILEAASQRSTEKVRRLLESGSHKRIERLRLKSSGDV